MWNSIPEENKESLTCPRYETWERVSSDQELLDVSELLFRFATARLKGSQLQSRPPGNAVSMSGFLRRRSPRLFAQFACLVRLFGKKHCTLKQRFQFKVESSVPWSILDIKGVGDQYFNIRHYPIWGAHIFFVVFFFLTWIWRDAFILEMSEITRCSRKTSNHTHTCGKNVKKI